MNKPMGNRVRTMTQLALLLALLLILSYTPLGYLPVGPLVLSLLSVPVAIGAMLLGPLGGAVLGGAFGLTSTAQHRTAPPSPSNITPHNKHKNIFFFIFYSFKFHLINLFSSFHTLL